MYKPKVILICSLHILLLSCATQRVVANDISQPFSISSYKVQIKPNFMNFSIEGSTELTLNFNRVARSLTILVNDLVLDEVSSDAKDVQWKQDGKELRITFSASPKTLFIRYHGKPQKGLVWGKDFVYSAYFTCHWMICDEDPGRKAPVDLTIIAPSEYKTTASGNFEGVSTAIDGLSQFRWREEKPYSTYLFGFAAGKFNEAHIKVRGKTLRLLGVEDDRKSLLRKFLDTSKALKFFEKKAGLPLQHLTYTQVLVPDSEAQENNAFAVIGRKELDPILADPQEDWSFVHELSHQWWGNLLTCKSWQYGWLNEGVTVFMTASYKEQRWGKQAYQREMELAKKRWQRAIDINFDKPLSFEGPYPSLGIQRSIIYSKAALFMDALRTEMGEKNFWSGLKLYTQKFSYQSVESKDFQIVMEATVNRSLSQIFDRWVY